MQKAELSAEVGASCHRLLSQGPVVTCACGSGQVFLSLPFIQSPSAWVKQETSVISEQNTTVGLTKQDWQALVNSYGQGHSSFTIDERL